MKGEEELVGGAKGVEFVWGRGKGPTRRYKKNLELSPN